MYLLEEIGQVRAECALPSERFMNVDSQDIVVIGASAGGIEALIELVSALPADLQASIFVVMHLPAWHDSALPAILTRSGPLPALHPESGEIIKRGRIYVAPPDKHLLIHSGDRVELWHGPKENNCRPSINALFRSAAVAYGKRVAGVILTGALDDGATGLWWIKQREGIAIVQDPEDAQFPQMPQAALTHVPADYVLPAADLAHILTALARGVRQPTAGRGEELPKI
jgi:two-component system, chemotaxis family, protein-glutamate methylesterase/glutaminase